MASASKSAIVKSVPPPPACTTWGFPETIDSNSDEAIQNLYSLLECPVCKQFPDSGTVFSCQNNKHIICEKCVPSSRVCPACSDTIPEEISYAAINCIANCLIPCKWKFQGCPHIIRGKNIRDHILNCNYRPIKCIMSKCDEIVPFRHLFDHLCKFHGKKVNGVKDCNRHIVEWWIEGDIFATARWPPFYFTCFNNVFLYMCISTMHGTWEWAWMLGSEEEAKRFRIESKMENVESVISLQWKGAVHSIRTPVTDIIASGQVFISNSKEIRNPFMYRKGNDMKNYWRTEVVIHQVSPPNPTSMPYLETNEATKLMISKPNDNWSYTIDISDKAKDYQARLLSGIPYKLVKSEFTQANDISTAKEIQEIKRTKSTKSKVEIQSKSNSDIVNQQNANRNPQNENYDIENNPSMMDAAVGGESDMKLMRSKSKLQILSKAEFENDDDEPTSPLEDKDNAALRGVNSVNKMQDVGDFDTQEKAENSKSIQEITASKLAMRIDEDDTPADDDNDILNTITTSEYYVDPDSESFDDINDGQTFNEVVPENNEEENSLSTSASVKRINSNPNYDEKQKPLKTNFGYNSQME